MARPASESATVHIVPITQARPAQAQSLRMRIEADDRLLLTVSEAARRLGIGRSLLYELLMDGQIESIHVGRLRRIPTDALVAYIEAQRVRRLDREDQGGCS